MLNKTYQEKRRKIIARFVEFAGHHDSQRPRDLSLGAVVAAYLASLSQSHHALRSKVNNHRAMVQYVLVRLCHKFGARTSVSEFVRHPARLQAWSDSNR